ncbi:hypothetical protein [Humibacillus xanthopallidus]|nr:hypothetical protein [Humibacillus xanthopallidus]
MDASNAIAAMSVVSTAIVAVVSLLIQARSADKQREHDRTLSWETRSWEAQSQAIFAAVREARSLLDALERLGTGYMGDVELVGRAMHHFLQTSPEVLPQMEAYASAEAVEKWLEIRRALQLSYVSREALDMLEELGAERRDAFARYDLGAAEDASKILREEKAELRDEMNLPADLAEQLESFIDAARRSARGDRSR